MSGARQPKLSLAYMSAWNQYKSKSIMGMLGQNNLEGFVREKLWHIRFSPDIWVAFGLLNKRLEGANTYKLSGTCDVVPIFLACYYLELLIKQDASLRNKLRNYVANEQYRDLHNQLRDENYTHEIPFKVLDHFQPQIMRAEQSKLAVPSDERQTFLAYLLFEVIPNRRQEDFDKISAYRHKICDSHPHLAILIDVFVSQVLHITGKSFKKPDYSSKGKKRWNAFFASEENSSAASDGKFNSEMKNTI